MIISPSNMTGNGIIQSDSVFNAMAAVDRGEYSEQSPYMDSPQSIGYGVTISAPHMASYLVSFLKINYRVRQVG